MFDTRTGRFHRHYPGQRFPTLYRDFQLDMTSDKAGYRKYNDRSLSSSTYHKKDGTNIRAKLKKETTKEIKEAKAGK